MIGWCISAATNAYPSYNEEHGVWIDDRKAIAEWKGKFWNELLARSDVPDDEGVATKQ